MALTAKKKTQEEELNRNTASISRTSMKWHYTTIPLFHHTGQFRWTLKRNPDVERVSHGPTWRDEKGCHVVALSHGCQRQEQVRKLLCLPPAQHNQALTVYVDALLWIKWKLSLCSNRIYRYDIVFTFITEFCVTGAVGSGGSSTPYSTHYTKHTPKKTKQKKTVHLCYITYRKH